MSTKFLSILVFVAAMPSLMALAKSESLSGNKTVCPACDDVKKYVELGKQLYDSNFSGYHDVNSKAVFYRSVVDMGDRSRIQKIFNKASNGEEVTIGVIGGSITAGASATKPEYVYGNRVAEWFRKTFPDAKINFVNAGIGATDSLYGAFRVKSHLLEKNPDFVIVEYAVNDSANQQRANLTIEGLVRQILESKNKPAVMMIFTGDKDGINYQQKHIAVGRYYGIPMLSYRDAFYDEISTGRIPVKDLFADEVHPTDLGHYWIASLITTYLESCHQNTNISSTHEEIPKPLYTDIYENTNLFKAEDLKPISAVGWSLKERGNLGNCWFSDKPGSSIIFELSGNVIALMYYNVRENKGMVEIEVDGKNFGKFNAWGEQRWGGRYAIDVIAEGPGNKKHKVKMTLLNEKSPESNGYDFELMALFSAECKIEYSSGLELN